LQALNQTEGSQLTVASSEANEGHTIMIVFVALALAIAMSPIWDAALALGLEHSRL